MEHEMADFASALKTMFFQSPGLRTQSPCSFLFILKSFSRNTSTFFETGKSDTIKLANKITNFGFTTVWICEFFLCLGVFVCSILLQDSLLSCLFFVLCHWWVSQVFTRRVSPNFGGEQIFPATYVAAYVDVDCLLLVSSFCSFYFFCSYSPTWTEGPC